MGTASYADDARRAGPGASSGSRARIRPWRSRCHRRANQAVQGSRARTRLSGDRRAAVRQTHAGACEPDARPARSHRQGRIDRRRDRGGAGAQEHFGRGSESDRRARPQPRRNARAPDRCGRAAGCRLRRDGGRGATHPAGGGRAGAISRASGRRYQRRGTSADRLRSNRSMARVDALGRPTRRSRNASSALRRRIGSICAGTIRRPPPRR